MKRVSRPCVPEASSDRNHRLSSIGRSGTLGHYDTIRPQPLTVADHRRSTSVSYLDSNRPNFTSMNPPRSPQPSPIRSTRADSSAGFDPAQFQQFSNYQYGENKGGVGEATGSNYSIDDDPIVFEMQKRILKAKAEGSTVSVVAGRLFIDYKFIGMLPNGCIV